MSEFLITGGAGFIGSHLSERLLQEGEVTVVDDLSTGHWSNVPEGVKRVEADVNQTDLKKTFEGIDYVYHYAAVVGVEKTLANPYGVMHDIDGFRNVLEAARQTEVKRVLFASSSEIYGEPVESPQHEETTPLNSRLPYAVVKNVGEAMLKAYSQEFGLDYTIFRFFNTYGPRQRRDFVMSGFLRAAQSGEDLGVYGGEQTRTFCYIDDNIEATVAALETEPGEIINIGSDEEISILDLARKIIELSSSSSEIIKLPSRVEGDMTRRRPDITKMKALLGRDPIPLDEGLAKLWT